MWHTGLDALTPLCDAPPAQRMPWPVSRTFCIRSYMLLLMTQLGSTLAMFGLIWFVQMVHYPLFLRVGEPGFRAYAAAHATRTTYVVAPLMLLELGSAALLLFARLRLPCIPAGDAWIGAVLVAAVWLSTAAVQVPLHSRLQAWYSQRDAQRLVATNWIRTVGWTLRAAFVLWWSYRCASAGAWVPHITIATR